MINLSPQYWNMVTDSDIRNLSLPDKLYSYADSYLSAATTFCIQLSTDTKLCTWSNGAVVMMLTAHSIELFLKAAILSKDAGSDILNQGNHSIDSLFMEFNTKYPEPKYRWDNPFRTAYPDNMDEGDLKKIKNSAPHPSILYRYPVDRTGKDWQGAYGFEPHSYKLLLEQLKSDFIRIQSSSSLSKAGNLSVNTVVEAQVSRTS